MRTIIAGSRGCNNIKELHAALYECGWKPTVVLSGAARGADRLGELWAAEYSIPCERFPAEWGVYGKSAGYRRNILMADSAEALIALWDGASKGTAHMITLAKNKGLVVHVHLIGKNS